MKLGRGEGGEMITGHQRVGRVSGLKGNIPKRNPTEKKYFKRSFKNRGKLFLLGQVRLG